ncbi:MAG TPA: alpha/beta fold hydrolase [Micromonosporaceae bacterium]|jgi:pimeloyl-ACP methyl ester carboxylesterase|nr:alpha/beta fold hydrolase [Micromonosporaceae bacterium]
MPTLALSGADLYYEMVGEGTPVVLVHGLGLDTRMWDDQIDALRSIATVIRYDARGFGRSLRLDNVTEYTNSSDLWALLDHVSVESAVLVGLSMGGGIVLEAIVERPERVRAMVLLDPYLDGVPWDDESARGMRAIRDGVREGGLPAAKAAWLRHGFFAPALRRPDLARRLAAMTDDYSGVHWTDHDPHGPHPEVRGRLATITVPTTVVVGALDVPCFHDMADILAAEIATSRKIVVPNAGHMVNMEAPDAVNDVLSEVVRAAQ